MKTTFSRTFFPAVLIFLAGLLLVGVSFQSLFRSFMKKQAIGNLQNDAQTISDLAVAYYTQDSLSHQDFLVNLNFVSQVSQADAVICDSTGRLVLCSRAPFGCGHQGMVVSQEFLGEVFSTGCVTTTGVIQGLYEDERRQPSQTVSYL